MNKSYLSMIALSASLLAAGLTASPAMAARVDVGVNIGVPVYMPPPPVYAPPPVIYAPPPVVYVERDGYYRRGPGYHHYHRRPPHYPGPYYRHW